MKNSKDSSQLPVGIDLGTTFSSIAVFRHGKPEVIPNSQYGERLTPSVVFYDPNSTDISVGKYAEEWGIQAKTNLLYDTKRLMGRKYDDVYVQNLIKNNEYNYKLVRAGEDDLRIEVKQNNTIKHILPEEVGSEILKYLKDSASEYLGEEVSEAVISVPAHFSNAQRNATKKAAELAGLKVLKLISEPVAAAIHYSMNKLERKATLLVFDFGGGTLDISVVEVNNGTFKVRGIEGDSFLGGRDLDRNLMNHVFSDAIAGMKDKNKKDYNAQHLLRVKRACTKIKIMLSTKTQATMILDHFGRTEDNYFNMTMSQEQFETLNKDIFNRATDLVTSCLNDLELSAKDIDQVVLVGGSTRIPKVRKIIESYFGRHKLKTDVNPDEAVALGAAVQAAGIKEQVKELENFKIIEVAPLSIGIDVEGRKMAIGIKKNTILPAKSTIRIHTTENDELMIINVYEGERKNSKYNVLLGSMSFPDLKLGKAGDVKFDVEFNLDTDGILKVEAWEICKNHKNKVVIDLKPHRLGQKQIKSILADADRFKEEDIMFERSMTYRAESKKYCYGIIYDLSKILDEKKRNEVKRLCENYIQYANDATDTEINKHTFDNLKKEFQAFKQEVAPQIKNLISVTDDTIYIE